MRAQKFPKSVQVAPKTGPRDFQIPPKTSLGRTKVILWRLWCGQLHSKGFWSDFLPSVASFVLLAKCVPTQSNCGFVTLAAFGQRKRASTQKHGKNMVLEVPKPRKSSPERLLEHSKTRKKQQTGPTNAVRREKCAQDAPKSENCANMAPTGTSFDLDSGSADPL